MCVHRGKFRVLRVAGRVYGAGGGGNANRAGDSGAGWREKFGGRRFRDRARWQICVDRGRFGDRVLQGEDLGEGGHLGPEFGSVHRSRFWGKGLQGERLGERGRFRGREERKGGLVVGGSFRGSVWRGRLGEEGGGMCVDGAGFGTGIA